MKPILFWSSIISSTLSFIKTLRSPKFCNSNTAFVSVTLNFLVLAVPAADIVPCSQKTPFLKWLFNRFLALLSFVDFSFSFAKCNFRNSCCCCISILSKSALKLSGCSFSYASNALLPPLLVCRISKGDCIFVLDVHLPFFFSIALTAKYIGNASFISVASSSVYGVYFPLSSFLK